MGQLDQSEASIWPICLETGVLPTLIQVVPEFSGELTNLRPSSPGWVGTGLGCVGAWPTRLSPVPRELSEVTGLWAANPAKFAGQPWSLALSNPLTNRGGLPALPRFCGPTILLPKPTPQIVPSCGNKLCQVSKCPFGRPTGSCSLLLGRPTTYPGLSVVGLRGFPAHS